MKIDFYHEAIPEKFERFTFLGIQLNKHENGVYYVSIWILGFGMAIVFN